MRSQFSVTISDDDSAVEGLVARLERFPSVVRGEQLRAWLILAVFTVLYALVVLGFLAVAQRVTGYVATRGPAQVREPVNFLLDAVALWLGYKIFYRSFVRIFRVLFTFLGVRTKPFSTLGTAAAIQELHRARPFGLYLRSFFDDVGLVPTSRLELSKAVGALEIKVIAVENTRATPQLDGLLVLAIPKSQWKETVLQLMRLASVIIVDVNVGILHWLDEIPQEMGFSEREAEVGRREGMVTELEEILARGFTDKTVILAPPGWPRLLESGEVGHHIQREQVAALERHWKIINARGKRATREEIGDVQWFTRTRIKRALPRFGRVATTVDEVVRQVGDVVRTGVSADPEGDPAARLRRTSA